MKIINILFREKTDNTIVQLLRYTFVGGLAFIIDFGMLALLTELFHIYYLVSAAIAFIFGLFTNYILSIQWVFNIHSKKNICTELIIFTIIGIIGLGLNEIIMWLFTDYLNLTYYLISKIISTGIVYLWNFFARKYLLFSKKA